MKQVVLLSLLLVYVHVHCAPDVQPSALSCKDEAAISVAGEALDMINKDRQEGYIFTLLRLANINTKTYGDNGIIYYLTLDVQETTAHVFTKADWKNCTARADSDMPVYGQCKATFFINKPQRVVRLYKYDCIIRPIPPRAILRRCPDCPILVSVTDPSIQRTVAGCLKKFNNDYAMGKTFSLTNVARAKIQRGIAKFDIVEFTIMETTNKSTGFCKGNRYQPHVPTLEGDVYKVSCQIFEADNDTHTHNNSHSHHNDSDHHHHHHHHPVGKVKMLPPMNLDSPSGPVQLPTPPHMPVTLPSFPNMQIPLGNEPSISTFPPSVAAGCPAVELGHTIVEEVFDKDPLFKVAQSKQ
ncbi:fetuin-B-like [Thalassophryne amazonica]|uniref:fetuin-B-like n=1 Tax=Thalassophryne amazonica TaxID=390379 RepID=UPI00147142EA|nr:fetuin-B-like [Thalassophryne amazonica]